jgi:hypothetical protein
MMERESAGPVKVRREEKRREEEREEHCKFGERISKPRTGGMVLSLT